MPQVDQNQLITDDEDFEGSGSTSDYYYVTAVVEWSEWSDCSSTCGLGVQHRTSRCIDDTCIERKETRPCNSGPCFNRRRTNSGEFCNLILNL
ncbi:hypothetical protein O3M35_006638 [Rhynocoris fuscipes]|uniref:CCN TSP1 domain-containing protein n=1 Tax=Rhynocoris fuscipes TaxID=488301 RepID=A0AAW1DLG1_9HEMI